MKNKKKIEKNATFTISFTTNSKWQIVISWQKSNFSSELKLEPVST